MTDGERLVVLTSADPDDSTAPLLDSLAAWSRAGLLGNVVWCAAHDLASQGYDAPGWASLDGIWHQTTVGQAMESRPLSKVSLAALRHPRTSRDNRERELARRKEEEAHGSVVGLLGTAVGFTSTTVSVATTGSERGIADSSPLWNLHLVHNIKVEAHEAGPRMLAAQRAPMELCAMIALCAFGGWRGSTTALELQPDLLDGPTKPVRFVHCQMRVLLTPSAAQIAMPSSMPASPPWPLPQASGTAPAIPTAVPPLGVAEQLAETCDFQCRQPPRQLEPQREFELVRLWRDLFRPVPTPMPPTDLEAALRRLADRTGGLRDEMAQGLTPLKLEGVDNLISLDAQIRDSDFPLPDGSSSSFGAPRPTPYEWQTLREVMFGLVDGGSLPGGVPYPRQGEGGETVRLVWTNPAGIAPTQAPRDASDVLLGLEAPIEDPEGEPAENGEEGEATEAGNPDAVPDEIPFQPKLEEPAGDHAGAENPEVLMVRLADKIHRALRSAHRGFLQNAALCSVGSEHEEAVVAQKWARRWLRLLGVVLVVGAVAALDGWRPFLGPAWEFLTPFEARRILVSDLWPYGWLAIGLLVFAGVVALFLVQVFRLSANRCQVQETNAHRERLGANASHYVSELLRLRGVAEQFADHRAIITEFLYRPFGAHERSRANALSAPDLKFTNEPPPSMLVACVEPSPESVDVVLKLKQASTISQGWLTTAFRQAKAVWNERYQRRVVGEFEDPDHDATPPGTVVHRDPRDGSDVFGPRTDFLLSVVGGPGETRGGWALRKAADERFAGLLNDLDGGIDGFLGLLGPLEPVHGAPGGIGHDPAAFMMFGSSPRLFDWNQVLAAGAQAPKVDKVEVASEPWLVPNAGEGHSLVLAWRMELSGPVRPQDLAGWQLGGGPKDPPEAPKQVV